MNGGHAHANGWENSVGVSVPTLPTLPVGMINNDNICFFNSVIQISWSWQSFREYYLRFKQNHWLNDLLSKLQKASEEGTEVCLKGFLMKLESKWLIEYRLRDHYDASECLTQLLDHLRKTDHNLSSMVTIQGKSEFSCQCNLGRKHIVPFKRSCLTFECSA